MCTHTLLPSTPVQRCAIQFQHHHTATLLGLSTPNQQCNKCEVFLHCATRSLAGTIAVATLSTAYSALHSAVTAAVPLQSLLLQRLSIGAAAVQAFAFGGRGTTCSEYQNLAHATRNSASCVLYRLGQAFSHVAALSLEACSVSSCCSCGT